MKKLETSQVNRLHLDVPDQLIDLIAEKVADRIGPGSNPNELLTVEEAAQVLRCRPKRVYDLCSQRRLNFLKDGSRTLIRRSAIDQYLEGGS